MKKQATSTFGHPLPDNYRRDDVDDLSNAAVQSELDLHLVRLLAAHPALQVRFRNPDLALLDDVAKRRLLDEMNSVLGIQPLRTSDS